MPEDDPDYVKYARDIAYQKYVLEQCGVKVTGTYLVRIDKDYERGEQLDIKGLLKPTSVLYDVKGFLPKDELLDGRL